MSPPKLARRLLAWTVPREDREDVVANFDELFEMRRQRTGGFKARLWYWRQAVSFSARLRFTTWSSDPASALLSPTLSQFLQDVGFAFRSLRKSPGFLVAVVATLGLGFGANVVIFAVVNASILRPLPFPESSDLVWVWASGNMSLTHERFAELRPQAESFVELTAHAYRDYSIQGEGGDAAVVAGASVSTNHFDVLGLPPAAGRAIGAEDGFPGAEAVAVISHELWESRFGADPSIVGQTVDLFTAASIPMVLGAFSGAPHRVVGILQPGYRPFGYDAQVYTPLVADPDDPNYANMGELTVLGRMAASRTAEGIHTELVRVSERLPSFSRLVEGIRQDRVISLRDALYGPLRPAMLLTLAAALLVLLAACANVANLGLSRGEARRQELAIRNAVGAGRGRLVRQLLTESLVVSTIAAVAGLGTAYVLLPVTVSLLPQSVAPYQEVVIGGTALSFALAVLLLAVLISGIAPAVVYTKRFGASLAGSERAVGFGRGRQRVANVLVASEIALALLLAHSAGLLVKSFSELTGSDPGFSPSDVVTMKVTPVEVQYRDADSRRALFAEIMDEANSIPGVESVGAIHFLPVAEGGPGINFLMDPADPETARSSGYRVVTPGYMETMGIPLLQGRPLAQSDVSGGALVGLINRNLADLLWPDESAIGKAVYRTSGAVMFTVVGVVGDVTQAAIGLPPQPEIYLPLAQTEWANVMTLVVHTAGPVPGLEVRLREIVRAIDPHIPVTRITSMERILSDSVASPRFYGILFSLFAGLALLLGAIGVYGVVAAGVNERKDEIGIRLALGATQDGILKRELLRGSRVIGLGIAAGLGLAMIATRFLTSMLYQVSPADATVVVATSLMLGLVAVAGMTIPAVRASRLDPNGAIRRTT